MELREIKELIISLEIKHSKKIGVNDIVLGYSNNHIEVYVVEDSGYDSDYVNNIESIPLN